MQASTKALPFLSILNGLNKFHGKHYCYPSQEKILTLLGDRLAVFMSIASLNRHLKAIVNEGYIKRRRRIRRDPILGMVFQSTLYIITRKGYYLLARFGKILLNKFPGPKNPRGRKSRKGPQDPEHIFHGGRIIPYKKWLSEE